MCLDSSLTTTARDEEGTEEDMAARATSETLLLLVSHSMSAKPFVCTYRDLAESNLQLLGWKSRTPPGDSGEAVVAPSSEKSEYVIPEGGPRLAGACVVCGC